MQKKKTKSATDRKIEQLEIQLSEALETIQAIRDGQVDALVVNTDNGHALFTLKSADHAYRIFIEKMTEGAATLSTAGLIIYCNSNFATMLGKPLASVIGTPMLDYIADPLKREFSELFDTGWAADVRRESQFSIDGRQIPVKLSVNALQMDAGPALNIIITDLTQQKESERELMEKNKMLKLVNDALAQSNYDLQQFASVASHDLQEPLRKIQVFSKFLMDKNLDPMSEASREYIEKIFSSSNRMKALIIDILAYSRLSAIDSNVEQVELRELLEDIIDDFDLRIAEQNAIVELRDLPVVEANRGQFRQVFNNLLSNALKFTQPGSQPHIIISNRIVKAEDVGPLPGAPEDYYNISFRDNGIGFNEKFAATIFTLFEKLHPKSAFEGSGIGLAIAKKIVEKHQGRILAHSQEGMGAEFNIILPRLRTLGN